MNTWSFRREASGDGEKDDYPTKGDAAAKGEAGPYKFDTIPKNATVPNLKLSAERVYSDSMSKIFVIAAALMLAACSTPPQVFLHQSHRLNFALTDQELRGAQFSLDKEILLQGMSPGTPPSMLVRKGTLGAAVSMGSNWIRVRFQEDGPGVPFVADPNREGGSAYLLGTETAQGVYDRVANRSDRILAVAGQNYRVVYGETAQLFIDGSDLQDLIDRRSILEGARPPKQSGS